MSNDSIFDLPLCSGALFAVLTARNLLEKYIFGAFPIEDFAFVYHVPNMSV